MFQPVQAVEGLVQSVECPVTRKETADTRVPSQEEALFSQLLYMAAVRFQYRLGTWMLMKSFLGILAMMISVETSIRREENERYENTWNGEWKMKIKQSD